ncbi:MAG: hypothetical protein V4492_08860 [Chlamydiota bacterium]
MKKILASLVALSICSSGYAESMEQWKKDTESLWRTGSGVEDGAYTAIATSMLGWGLGLSAGFAVLASVLHQSAAGHSSSHCSGS